MRENVGKKVVVGNSDIRVEIASYLPDARPDAAAHFTTASRQPNNPLLELKIYLPGKDQPLRQIAFAKNPLLSLDAIHGWDCPVKFWYHHPAVAPQTGTQFLETPEGRLYYRVAADGKLLSHGEAKEGSRIVTPDQLRLSVVKHLPHARRKIAFLPLYASGDEGAASEAAALIKVQAGGAATEVWLKRADPEYGFQQIATPEGPLGIAFGYERLPLGFSLRLAGFQHGQNSGMMGDASSAGSVRVMDKARGVDRLAEITVNQPLVYGGFTFFQAGHDQSADGRQVLVLAAASDPGRFLKYLGGLLIGLGACAAFYKRGVFAFTNAEQAQRRKAHSFLMGWKAGMPMIRW